MSLAQGWGSAADLQMQIQGLQMENTRLKEGLAEEEYKLDCVEVQCGDYEATIRELREQLAAAQASYFQLSCDLAAAQKDAERYRWLRKEHDLVNPLAAVCWKRNADRGESNWVNTINAENLDNAIDAAIGKENEQ